jgi:hypothetical protein
MRQEPRPCSGCGDDKCLSWSNTGRAEHDGRACKVVTCMAQWDTLNVTSRVATRTAGGTVRRRKTGGEMKVQLRLLVQTYEGR